MKEVSSQLLREYKIYDINEAYELFDRAAYTIEKLQKEIDKLKGSKNEV